MFCALRKELGDNQPVQDNIFAKLGGENVRQCWKSKFLGIWWRTAT